MLLSPPAKKDQLSAAFLEIYPVAGTVIDFQLRNTFGNRLDMPRISCGKAFDPDENAGPCADVPQVVEPFGETV